MSSTRNARVRLDKYPIDRQHEGDDVKVLARDNE